MGVVRVDDDVLVAFRRAVVARHGSLRGPMMEEATEALRARTVILQGQGARQP